MSDAPDSTATPPFLDLTGTAPATTGHTADWVQRLQQAFAEECVAHHVRGAITGGPDAWTVTFEGQENASPELMLEAFLGELRHAGILAAPRMVLPGTASDADTERALEVFRHCARRMRTLLVEHNSYLSGGLRYPFPPSVPGVAERGLAIYRFPKHGAVDVTAIDDRIRIDFAPGDLGAVTSSGFYLPTLFAGDFSVAAEYEIRNWRPDVVEPGCFALFAQNEDSTCRYYAQRMSAGNAAHRVLASMCDDLSAATEITGPRGAFRVARHDGRIHCGHRQGEKGAWTELGSAPAPADREMILGAKIWSKLRCDGLTADVYDLRIEGRMAERQVAPVPVVPDPRNETQG